MSFDNTSKDQVCKKTNETNTTHDNTAKDQVCKKISEMSENTTKDQVCKKTMIVFSLQNFRFTSLKQLLSIIFAMDFNIFSPSSIEIFMEFLQTQLLQSLACLQMRKPINGIVHAAVVNFQEKQPPIIYTYGNTYIVPFGEFKYTHDIIGEISNFSQQKLDSSLPLRHFINITAAPILKYRFPRTSHRRNFVGKPRDFMAGTNIVRYATNDLYHAIAFDCCSKIEFSKAKFIDAQSGQTFNQQAQQTQQTQQTRPISNQHMQHTQQTQQAQKLHLTPQEQIENNEYADPESPNAKELFAGKFIIVSQREDSGVSIMKSDLVYSLVEQCLLSNEVVKYIEMPHVIYNSSSIKNLKQITSIYNELGIMGKYSQSQYTAEYIEKISLCFTGNGFYRGAACDSKLSNNPNDRILIDKPFLLIYIDEKNNPIFAGMISE